jgi:hypothetical protein
MPDELICPEVMIIVLFSIKRAGFTQPHGCVPLNQLCEFGTKEFRKECRLFMA